MTSTIAPPSARATSSKREQGWSAAIAPHVTALRASSHPAQASDAGKREGSNSRGPRTPDAHPSRRGIASGKTDGTYVVRPGDSLWSISERELKDPYRWPEIWKQNRDRPMPDGQRFVRPGYIRPGWILRLPALPTSGRGNSADGKARSKEETARAHEDERPTATSPSQPGSARSSNEPVPPPKSPALPQANEDEPSRRIELPSGTAVTAAFVAGLASGLAAAELRRRRRRLPQRPLSGWPKAGSARDFKSRLVRQALRSPGLNDEPVEADRVEGFIEATQVDDPSGIVLGHRDGVAVIARPAREVYSLTGASGDVESVFTDLALHSLFSHQRGLEVWATSKLGLPSADRLRVLKDAAGLVTELEVEVIKRRRILYEEQLEDWDTHRTEVSDDPLPLVVAFAPELTEALDDRFRAVAEHGGVLGLLVFAASLNAEDIKLEGGTLRPQGSSREYLGEGSFEAVRLADSERAELLASFQDSGDAGVAETNREPTGDQRQFAPPAVQSGEPSVEVRLFGPPRIASGGEEIEEGLAPKTREMLAYFALHPQGASRDKVVEALWPESEPAAVAQRFWSTLTKLRSGLRSNMAHSAKFIRRIGETYRIEPELFEVDVWTFDRLLQNAIQGDDAKERLVAAVETYKGALLEGIYCEWAGPLREHFRSRFVDATVHLAEMSSDREDFEAAVKALQRAIAVDPYAEHLYRRAMTLQGHLGRASDARKLYEDLETALEEIECEPSEETAAFKERLLEGAMRDATYVTANRRSGI